jgi:hypothetical protein
VIVFHKVDFPDHISRPPAMLKRTESTTRVLPLLTAALPLPRLQPDRSRAPTTGQAGLRNRRLCDPAPKFWEALFARMLPNFVTARLPTRSRGAAS